MKRNGEADLGVNGSETSVWKNEVVEIESDIGEEPNAMDDSSSLGFREREREILQ